jgi:hypothetical protein
VRPRNAYPSLLTLITKVRNQMKIHKKVRIDTLSKGQGSTGAESDPPVLCDLRDRLASLGDDPHRPLTELPIALSPLARHDAQLPL